MNKTSKIAVAAMLAALCCVATIVIKIPSPMNGYLNLGDCIVLLSGFMLTPMYGFFAAGIGSAMADVFSGYVLYAPITFLIKGIMVLTVYFIFKHMRRAGKIASRIIAGLAAEMIMVCGYYIFEGFLYGFAEALINIPSNCIQGLAGFVIGITLARIFEKY